MPAPLPGLYSTTRTPVVVRMREMPYVPGPAIVLDSSDVDSGQSPTSLIGPGNVVVLRTSTGRYVEANDANGDRNTQASVTALITNPGSGGWDGNLIIIHNGRSLTVALSGDNTDAAVVAAIKAAAAAEDPEFGSITAAVVSSRVVVYSQLYGADQSLEVYHASVATAFGAQYASTTYGHGSDADYRVTEDFCSLIDRDGNAVHGQVANSMAGFYDESNLTNLTGEARAVLSRRGSIFG